MCIEFNVQLFKWIRWISNKFTLKYAFDAISTSGSLFGAERHVCHLHKLGTDMFAIFFFSAFTMLPMFGKKKFRSSFKYLRFFHSLECVKCLNMLLWFAIFQIYINSYHMLYWDIKCTHLRSQTQKEKWVMMN